MVITPAKPMMIPAIIHRVIFAREESQTVKSVINNGTNAAMIAANPLLIYSSDQVSNPLAIQRRRIPCKEIFFSTSQDGNLYPLARKKETRMAPDKNCLTPATNNPGIYFAP